MISIIYANRKTSIFCLYLAIFLSGCSPSNVNHEVSNDLHSDQDKLSDDDSLKLMITDLKERGAESCRAGNYRMALSFAFQAGEKFMHLKGYPDRSDNLRKAVFYFEVQSVFKRAKDEICTPLADNIRALSLRYFQIAYDENEAVTPDGNSIEESRSKIMAIIIALSKGIVDPNTTAWFELQPHS